MEIFASREFWIGAGAGTMLAGGIGWFAYIRVAAELEGIARHLQMIPVTMRRRRR